MTKPITNDNFSTSPVVKARRIDAQNRGQHPSSDPGAQSTARAGDKADVNRAQQLLSQETEQTREPAITSSEQARERVAQLKAQIAADPQTANRAHGNIDNDFFEAATARPAA